MADALVIGGCWVGAYLIRFAIPLPAVTKGIPPISLYLWALILVEAIWLTTLSFEGLYRVGGRTAKQLFFLVVRAEIVAFLLLIAATYFTHRQSFSRIVMVYFLLSSAILLPVVRVYLRRLILASRTAQFTTNTLIVGAGELGQMTAERLRDRPELGVRLMGFAASDPRACKPTVCDIPVMGGYEDVNRVILENGIGLVLIALPHDSLHRLGEILDHISDEMVEVKVVPDFYRFASLGGSVEEFDGLHIITLRESPMHGWNRITKRLLDIVVAGLALIGCAPLMLLAAIAVKLSSPGPIFYVQERMGLDGRIFNMYKFRSMTVGAESSTGPVWAQPDDPRRTRTGTFLRRYSIDELPQLVHVLKGEMSLVGPRPERPELIEEFKTEIPRYMLRHKMKAGMTGWAQVNGLRGNTSLADRIDHDLEYIRNWSLGFDLKILAMTLHSVITDKNAY